MNKNIRKRKDGKYFIDFTYKGKRVRRVVGYSKTEAKEIMEEIRAKIRRGKYGLDKKSENIKFEDFAKEFIDNYAKVNKRSWKRDQTSLNNLIPFFKGYYLSKITPAMIEKYKAKRKADTNRKGENIAETTINRELTCLKTLYNKANEWNKANHNPTSNIKNFKENNTTQIILNSREVKRLIDSAVDHLKPIIVIAVNTGMRRGEILSLKWKNINFIKGYIEIEDSKSGESRKVPMNSIVFETLKRMDKKHRYVFYNPKTKKNIVEIKRSFNTARKKAGLKKVRFHDLRHTAATRMCELGVPLKVVSKILGHSTIKMTERYANPTPDSMKEAVESLADVLKTRHKVDTSQILPGRDSDVNHSYLYN